MAYISTVSSGALYTGTLYNLTPKRVEVLWILLSAFLAAGWRCVKSGDGLSTYNSSSEGAITNVSTTDTTNYEPNDGSSYAKIAGSIANIRAWFVIKTPAAAAQQAELCFQLVASEGDFNDLEWRVKYSVGGFTGGSPSATRVPTAAAGDERVLTGAGTDASPVGGTALFDFDGQFRFNCFVDADTATPRMWARAWTSATDTVVFALTWDFTTGLKAGGTDPSPYVVNCNPGTHARSGDTTNVDVADFAFGTRYGTSGTTKCCAMYPKFSDGAEYMGGVGLSSIDSTEEPDYVLYVRPATAATHRGRKGVSTMCGWCATARSFADHLTISGVRSFVYVEKLWLPWPVSGTACVR